MLRRTFVKGAAAASVAATGITAFSGGTAAQQNAQQLEVGDVQVSDGLLTIEIQNFDAIDDIDIEGVAVTIIGGDVGEILVFEEGVIDLEDGVINIELEDIDAEILTDNVVQVAVAVLGDAGNVVAQGSTAEDGLEEDEEEDDGTPGEGPPEDE